MTARGFRAASCRLSMGLALGFVSWGMAADYAVSPAGSDENPGTLEQPFKTLAMAMSRAGGGDTVWIDGGVYAEPLVIRNAGEEWLTVKAIDNRNVVIRHAERLPPDFVPDHGVYSIDYEQAIGGIVWDIENHPRVTAFLERRKDRDALARERGGGFAFDPLRKKLFVKAENRDDDPNRQPLMASFLTAGIQISGQHIAVEGITVELAASHGISIVNAEGVTVRRCRVVGTASQWSFLYGIANSKRITIEECTGSRGFGAVSLYDSQDVTIRHCAFYRTRNHGVLFGGENARLSITDNILCVTRVGTCVYYMLTKPEDSTFDYNCVLKCDLLPPRHLGIFWAGEMLSLPEAIHEKTGYERHSICADPTFVSTRIEDEDLMTAEDSPCRNRGRDGGTIGLTVSLRP